MDCCEKKPRKLRALPFLAAVAAVIAVAVANLRPQPAARPDGSEAKGEPPILLVPRPPTRPPVGDAEHGRELYAMHCASCHGMKADGTGPAADYLWPLPRDHRDAAYMLSRSDDQLFKAVAHGGRGVSRSYLMPPWNDVFDRFQTWNLVAYLRSLAPELPAGVARATYHQVLLSGGRHRQIESAGVARLIGFVRCLELDPDEEEVLKYFMVFPQLEAGEDTTTVSLLFDPEARLTSAETLHQIRISGASPDAVDRHVRALVDGATPEDGLQRTSDLASGLAGIIGKAPLLMRLILEQEKEDTQAAVEAYRTYTERPESLSRGARLYMQSCAACHGFTGRVVGPLVTERDAWPRALADGAVMSRLSDSYLKSLVRQGGLHWNLSGAMPANPALTDEEIGDLVGYVRSLADPPGNGRCPCGAIGMQCGSSHDPKACGCRGGQGGGGLCPLMKR